MNSSRQSIEGKFYSNVLIVGKNNEHLSTVSDHKADWYLDKQLAVELTPPPKPYPRAIQLNFIHSPEHIPRTWDLHIGEDKCVICGTPQKLSLHHIVPYVIRRVLPEKYKQHSRQWCVLLCHHCHDMVEDISQPQYKKGFPAKGKVGWRRSTNITLQIVKQNGTIKHIPEEKIKVLLAKSDYKSVDEIPEYKPEHKRQHFANISRSHRAAINIWATKFIEDHGGIPGTEQYFLQLFLSFKPKHLPSWFDDLLK